MLAPQQMMPQQMLAPQQMMPQQMLVPQQMMPQQMMMQQMLMPPQQMMQQQVNVMHMGHINGMPMGGVMLSGAMPMGFIGHHY